MKICHAHCPKPGGGGGADLLVIVAVAAAGVGVAVWFILANLVVLALGAAGVLAVTAVSQLLLHRMTVVTGRDALRATRKAVEAPPLPVFAELAGKQPAAISARPPVIQATVISSTTVNARTGRVRQWPPQTS